MRTKFNRHVFCFCILPTIVCLIFSGSILASLKQDSNAVKLLELENGFVKCSLQVKDGQLVGERIALTADWAKRFDKAPPVMETDADFAIEVMWTGWRAPGKIHNADNRLVLTKKDFTVRDFKIRENENGSKCIDLFFSGIDNPFELLINYRLNKNAFYLKRRISIRDTKYGNHFLHFLWARRGVLSGTTSVIKKGGFGSPIALLSGEGGAFFGLEYPTSENHLSRDENSNFRLRCGQEIGEKIPKVWIASDWVVSALVPDHYVRRWFMKYLDDIRVAQLKPYLLYNTWYDVRSPEYTKRPDDVMNEKNLLRIVQDFKTQMIEKWGLTLDAFVLDDGWDVYASDWELRKEEFPNGLKPLSDILKKKLSSGLGIWFGPTGGYSLRDRRINWMREHGYEIVGNQLCIAGRKYHDLFKKRVVDLVRNEGVSYFKWDGIQFSCSEPDHGHPVGWYSRRAVMESIADLCKAVRTENQGVFLNITSGTWLSPWWLKYANTIWMQGRDYGYSNVPSISKRDSAITYRDVILYEDYGKNDFWFPIANLMTHGIIKGHLQKLGGEAEPLDKFTDNAILYFARGVAMWELYISPNLLSKHEWAAISKSIFWARDRFDILKTTEMVGGNPAEREPYGYVHFKGNRGIIAARNPFIEPKQLEILLSPEYGVNSEAKKLVLERTYPNRWISPRLYRAGSKVQIPLAGYETAIYEIYPLGDATQPLLAGPIFKSVRKNDKKFEFQCFATSEKTKVLNPDTVKEVISGEKKVDFDNLAIPARKNIKPFKHSSFGASTNKTGAKVNLNLKLKDIAKGATLAVLLEPDQEITSKKDNGDAKVTFKLRDTEVTPKIYTQKGQWAWYKLKLRKGDNRVSFRISHGEHLKYWKGKVSVWLIYSEELEPVSFDLNCKISFKKARPMPPQPNRPDLIKRNYKLWELLIDTSK